MLPERMTAFWLRIKALLRRRQLDRDLGDELEFHLAMREQKLAEQGVPAEEAHYAARRELGNVARTKEMSREMWTFAFLETLWQDLRFGLRQLRRNPGFTAVAIITLALGIGAATAVFSVVDAVLIRPLPYVHPEQLVSIWETFKKYNADNAPVSGPNFLNWKKENDVFSSLALGAIDDPSLTGQGEPEHLYGIQVTPEFFNLFGVQPAFGRAFLPDEIQEGKDEVVILGYGLWRRKFGSDRAVVGKAITLGGKKYAVIGIMPRAFRFPQIWGITDPEVYLPFAARQLNKDRDRGQAWMLGRLKPGVTITQAQADMATIAQRLAAQYPSANTGMGVNVLPLQEEVEQGTGPLLLILLGAVGFLVVIACANVANMMLVRTGQRRREMALRLAVGASRWRIVRQLLTESALLAILSCGVGIFIALWLRDALVFLSPEGTEGMLPQTNPITLNLSVLGIAVAVSIITGVLFGMVPALEASKANIGETLKEAARTTGSARSRRLRDGLVICEVGLALVLLIGGGLLIRSLRSILAANVGFDPKNLLTMRMSLPAPKYRTGRERLMFYQDILNHVRALPGVKAAAFAASPFLGGGDGGTIRVAGQSPGGPELQGPFAMFTYTTTGYFQIMGIPLLRGRLFQAVDYAGESHIAIISEKFAHVFWPKQDPIGKQFQIRTGDKTWFTVIGVVRDIDLRSWGADRLYPEAYFPSVQGRMPLVVRTVVSPLSLAKLIETQIWKADNRVPVYEVQTVEQIRASAVGAKRYATTLLGIFAFLSFLLAAIGIYAVASYSVTQRTHEIGIRMALGAQKRDVLRLVLGQGMILTLVGVGIGIIGALGLTRFLSSLLYGVKPTDPLTFIAVSLILTAVALLACYIPARRAMKIDPMEALRYE